VGENQSTCVPHLALSIIWNSFLGGLQANPAAFPASFSLHSSDGETTFLPVTYNTFMTDLHSATLLIAYPAEGVPVDYMGPVMTLGDAKDSTFVVQTTNDVWKTDVGPGLDGDPPKSSTAVVHFTATCGTGLVNVDGKCVVKGGGNDCSLCQCITTIGAKIDDGVAKIVAAINALPDKIAKAIAATYDDFLKKLQKMLEGFLKPSDAGLAEMQQATQDLKYWGPGQLLTDLGYQEFVTPNGILPYEGKDPPGLNWLTNPGYGNYYLRPRVPMLTLDPVAAREGRAVVIVPDTVNLAPFFKAFRANDVNTTVRDMLGMVIYVLFIYAVIHKFMPMAA
jgi:hypothetical protein